MAASMTVTNSELVVSLKIWRLTRVISSPRSEQNMAVARSPARTDAASNEAGTPFPTTSATTTASLPSARVKKSHRSPPT